MPSSIPYDPSLVLGNIVRQEALDIIKTIADVQAPVDAAQEALKSLISSKQSLDLTRTELANLGADITSLDRELSKLNDEIRKAAQEYAKQKIEAEETTRHQRRTLHELYTQAESPVDFVKTELKTMPLAADSKNMDVRYFAVDEKDTQGLAHGPVIAASVADTSDFLGVSFRDKLSSTAGLQATNMVKSHGITGTFVISVASTHKNASILAPFILNVEKAIKTWNRLYPDAADKLDPTKAAEMKKVATKEDVEDVEDKKHYSIASGMTLGSSFVGMLHIVDTTKTNVGQRLQNLGSSLQSQLDADAWFSRRQPQFDLKGFANEIEDLLKTHNISSHVSLITMGMPSIFANDDANSVPTVGNLDPKTNMEALNIKQEALLGSQQSVAGATEAALRNQSMITMVSNEPNAGSSALDNVNAHRNEILDVQSLVAFLEDYLQKTPGADSGVPINYYLKDIDRKMLAEMWFAKYFPGQFMAIKYDD